MEEKIIEMDEIYMNMADHSRAVIRKKAVNEICAAFKAGEIIPPPDVFSCCNRFCPADGFHRIKAARKAGMKKLLVHVHSGSRMRPMPDSECFNSKRI